MIKANKTEKRNVFLFSIGVFLSVFGSKIYTFAIGLYVLKLTGSGMNFAINLMSGVVATLIFSAIGGVVSDRLDKKKLIIAMDLMNGMMFLTVFIISRYEMLSIEIVYLSTFLTTGLTQIFGLAFDTSKPNMVTKKNVLKVNSIDKIISSVATIGGPAIGGVIFAMVDIELFILINAISFIISAVIEGFIQFDFNSSSVPHPNETFHFKKALQLGLDYILVHKDLRTIILLFTTINFFMSLAISVPLPYIINEVIKLSAQKYGVIESSLAVGMIIGAVSIPYVMKQFDQKKSLKVSTFLLSLIMIMLGVPLMVHMTSTRYFPSDFYFIYYSVMMILLGVNIAFIEIPFIYYMQTAIPEALRGRVMSIGFAGAKMIAPLGLILAGFLLDRVAAFVLPLVGGVILCMVVIGGVKFEKLR